MEIYCTEEFKIQFDKLMRKNSYKTVQNDIIDYFFGKDINDLKTGSLLNNCNINPYIKKRLNGRGGFRVYFLLVIKDEKLFLMFVHPKTGSLGYDNITDELKSKLYKDVLNAIQSNTLYELLLTDNKIQFKNTILETQQLL